MCFYSGTKRLRQIYCKVGYLSMSLKSINPTQDTVQELTEDERRAVSSLVLLNPDLLTAQYHTSSALASEAESYAKAENSPVAKNRFESAAKLALYEGDPVSGKLYLEKAVAIEKNSAFGYALSHFERIAKYVVESYKSKPVLVT